MKIIYLDALPADIDPKGHHLLSWSSVMKIGKESTKPYTVVNNAEAELLVMYTSGTTGNPKGVIHSIGALTHGYHALSSAITELIGQEPNETYVSYLPAAHIFEFTCELIMLSRGILLCFGSPRTLTDVSARPCGDITYYKPFFMIGVPRIFEAIKKTV
uniref:long-chain-fatty-acid--CoA ligase n=1 Tax=Lygus hesperus TaxID=30085 RepID=A0A0A9Y1M8_LYGHE